MGELILCSQQLAAMPYYIENVTLNGTWMQRLLLISRL